MSAVAERPPGPSLSVSTWSLHETLGPTYPDLALGDGHRRSQRPFGDGRCELLDVPEIVRSLGVGRLELCHFHLPSTDAGYLDELSARLRDADVTLTTLLVDAGDVTHPDASERREQLAHVRAWIELAARLGAGRLRIAPGDVDPDEPDAISRSAAAFRELLDHAEPLGVRLVTENWHAPLSLHPALMLELLHRLEGRVELCVDFGNYRPGEKERLLRALLPRASSIHAKAQYLPDGALDADEYAGWLQLAHAVGFDGDHVLIYAECGDELAGLAVVREHVLAAVGQPA